jgi:hypothetical protein
MLHYYKMIDYVYISPKIITAVFIFLLVHQSGINDTTLQIGLYSLLYYLTVKFGLGYDLNWKELTVATTVGAVLIHSRMQLYMKMLVFLSSLALLRPLCYIS